MFTLELCCTYSMQTAAAAAGLTPSRHTFTRSAAATVNRKSGTYFSRAKRIPYPLNRSGACLGHYSRRVSMIPLLPVIHPEDQSLSGDGVTSRETKEVRIYFKRGFSLREKVEHPGYRKALVLVTLWHKTFFWLPGKLPSSLPGLLPGPHMEGFLKAF